MRTHRTIRARLTLVATALMAIALTLASLLIVRLVENDVRAAGEEAVEAALRDRAGEIAERALVERGAGEGDKDAATGPTTLLLAGDGTLIEAGVFERRTDGELVFGTLFVDGEPVAELEVNTTLRTINELYDPTTGDPVDEPAIRAAVAELALIPVAVDERGERVLIGSADAAPLEISNDAVRRALAITVPLIVIAFALLCWWFVGRTLRPVARITDQVDVINASRLNERVAVPRTGDEIAHLATTMNAMLARLERADQQQRSFAADASHELRNPLATIRTSAELIETHPAVGADAELAQLATGVVAEADRLESLVDDLLRLARANPGEMPRAAREPLDLAVLATATAQTAALARQPNCGDAPVVDVRIEGDATMTGDRAAVATILDNLVSNARRHARSQVTITITDTDTDTDTDTISGDEAGVADAVRITVDDDGPGIAPDDRERVFERFTRLDADRGRRSGGAGLGLAIVASLTEHLDGTVHVAAAPGLGGARFVVILPRESAARA